MGLRRARNLCTRQGGLCLWQHPDTCRCCNDPEGYGFTFTAQVEAFKFKEDQKRALVSRLLQRQCVTAALGIPWEKVKSMQLTARVPCTSVSPPAWNISEASAARPMVETEDNVE